MNGTKNMRQAGGERAAFTLVELLVVIAIIAALAAMVANLAGRAAEKRIRARATVLVQEIQTAIEGYKQEKGFYPPDNQSRTNRPPLYYCLKGTVRSADASQFETKDGQTVAAADIKTTFGMDGFLNSTTDRSRIRDYYVGLKQSHILEQDGFRYLGFPTRGPEGDFNPVHYNVSSTNRHNLDSYDLWIEVVIGGKTVIIPNWRE